MCSGSKAGSYLRLIDFVYHSTLELRVIKKKKCGDLDLGSEDAVYRVGCEGEFGLPTSTAGWKPKECGKYKKVKARFRPWLPGSSP